VTAATDDVTGNDLSSSRRPAVEAPSDRDAFAKEFRRAHRRGLRRAAWLRALLNVTGILLFLAVWEAVPRLGTWVNPVLLPPPSAVFDTFVPMLLSGEIPANILASLRRAALGFAIATATGVTAGLLTARIGLLHHVSEPILHGFRSVPSIALVPLSVLWFGIGEGSKVALVAWGSFFPIWITTFIGVRDVPAAYLRSAACLGAGRLATLLLVVLPAALPMILAGLRQGIAVSLILLVAAELSGAREGVAYMMSTGHQMFRVDIMLIGLVLLGTFGFIADRLFVALIRRLFPWYTTAS